MDVWTIEPDDYDSSVWGVVSSLEAAKAWLSRMYAPPYVVAWSEPRKVRDDCWEITGVFEALAHHCGAGPKSYTLERYTLRAIQARLQLSVYRPIVGGWLGSRRGDGFSGGCLRVAFRVFRAPSIAQFVSSENRS